MSSTRSDTLQEICALIRSAGRVSDSDPDFSADTELFDSGYIGSLELVQLAETLEETFGVQLDEGDLFDPLFSTARGIADLISRRQALQPEELGARTSADQ